MNTFIIGSTEFGIDPGKSTIVHDRGQLTLEIRGDEHVFTILTCNEDSEWSWALYPPHLYIRGLETKGGKAVLNGQDDVEVALYMMEHNTILEATVSLTPANGVEVSGLVDLIGEVQPFRVSFVRSEA
ncbi:hypothetical protein [Silvimonas soli]|uniref:hypothetical protein n=1 Tax=Silvimonas soli TaxID=2980100 RepID=UPI0024B38CFF|nr:hypothetical protein [Silvimonas soli]